MPVVGPFATALYEELQPLTFADEENGWPLLLYLDALGQMFDEIEGLVRDTDDMPGWGILMDRNNAPAKALGWLAQMVGVYFEGDLYTEAQKRQLIGDTPGWKRGTVETIKKAAGLYLADGATVTIIERDGSPYHYNVVVSQADIIGPTTPLYPPFYPGASTYPSGLAAYISLITDILQKHKPAGLTYDLVIISGEIYFTIRANYATYNTVKTSFTDYADMRGT